MAWIATAIVGSAVINAVSSSRAADKASEAQTAAADASIEEQRRQYDITRQDYAPYREAGEEALGKLWDPNAFESSPGYDWRRSEGLRDLENRFSVGGGGGNAMRALVNYNQNLASNEYGNWWNRVADTAAMGAGMTRSGAAMGQNSANQISNAMLRSGDAQAQGYRDYYSGINNALQSGIGNWMYANQRGWLGGQGSPGSNYGYPTYSQEWGPPAPPPSRGPTR